jgi:cell division protein FtsB
MCFKCETVASFHFGTPCWFLNEFFSSYCRLFHVIAGCRSRENLGQAVIDLRLQEEEEENKIITEQLKKMIMEEEAMNRQICALHILSETVEHEAAALKAANLELQGKVWHFITTFLVLCWA